jgi:signal transduction histidine kinase
MVDLEIIARDDDVEFVPQWGDSAPKGGRAVLNRMLRDGSKVPLFLGQTFVNSLRDVGYNNTTSAVCEHVDNAIQAGASEVRVYFNQTGSRGKYDVDVAVFDNGPGMPCPSSGFLGQRARQNKGGSGASVW